MKDSINNHILSLAWLIFLIFPSNNAFFIFVPFAFIFLFDYKKKVNSEIFKYLILLTLIIVASFIVNINEFYVDNKSIFRSIVLIIMLLSYGRTRGYKILYPYIYIAIIVLFASQFSSALNISFINSIINSYYINEVEGNFEVVSMIDFSQFGIFRLGGIYINPNNYASFLGLVLTVILCEIKQFSRLGIIALFILIPLSLVATGSRTGLIVLVFTAIYYLYSSKVMSLKKAVFITIIFSAVVSVFLFNSVTDHYRILKVDEGIDNSIGVKINLLIDYINSDPTIDKLLFGNFSGEALQSYIGIYFSGMDFEIGNLILYYGFLFLITIVFFYTKIFKKMLPKYRVVFIVLLWMFSNSLLLSFRMSALWILILGVYYQRSMYTNKNLFIDNYEK